MATQFQDTEDQIDDLDENDPGEGEVTNPDDEGGDDEQEDDFEIGFDGEPANDADDDTPLVKKLRQEIRERDRKLAEAAKAPAKIEVGPKPDLWEDCDGDPDRFEAALTKWSEDKRAADEQESAETNKAEALNQEHVAALNDYAAKKSALARPDFDEAEQNVIADFDNARQAMIIHASNDSAKVIYALGRSQGKRAELAAITNPWKFVAAIAKLEEKITMTPRRKAPAPDKPLRGSAPLAQNDSDPELEKLEKEAARTNDRSKVIAYKRAKRQTAK